MVRRILLSVAVLAGMVFAGAATAEARHGCYRSYGYRGHHKHHRSSYYYGGPRYQHRSYYRGHSPYHYGYGHRGHRGGVSFSIGF